MTFHRVPDWYLASSEQRGDFAHPRACWVRRILTGPDEGQYVQVHVQPPVIGQAFGWGQDDIEDIIVAPRHVGSVLLPVQGFPVAVHVYVPRDEGVLQSGTFRPADFELAAWGELYRTEDDAARVNVD